MKVRRIRRGQGSILSPPGLDSIIIVSSTGKRRAMLRYRATLATANPAPSRATIT